MSPAIRRALLPLSASTFMAPVRFTRAFLPRIASILLCARTTDSVPARLNLLSSPPARTPRRDLSVAEMCTASPLMNHSPSSVVGPTLTLLSAKLTARPMEAAIETPVPFPDSVRDSACAAILPV